MKVLKFVLIMALLQIGISNVYGEAIRDPNFQYDLEYWLTAQEYASWGPVPLGTVTAMDTLSSSCARMNVAGAPSCVWLVTTTNDVLYSGNMVRISFYSTDMYAGQIELWIGDFWDATGTSGQHITYTGTSGFHELQLTCNRTYSKGTAIGIKLVVWPGSITTWIMSAHAAIVEDGGSSIEPLHNYYLEAPNPNPSNNNILLSYYIPKKTTVKLVIYDNTGKTVKTILDSQADIGKHDIYWDCKDEHGFKVAKGTYFCALETNDGSLVRKAIILR